MTCSKSTSKTPESIVLSVFLLNSSTFNTQLYCFWIVRIVKFQLRRYIKNFWSSQPVLVEKIILIAIITVKAKNKQTKTLKTLK